MVRVSAPALSLEASGTIGGAMVFSSWKGRPYVRERVIPSNPKSDAQVGVRQMMRWLSQQWDALASIDKASWAARAAAKVISPFNAYCGLGAYNWRDFLAPSMADPPARANTLPVLGALAAVASVRSITVTQPITTANDGWGVLFFRGGTTGFASAYDTMKFVGLIVGTADVVFVDGPLDPGTYYYNVRSFTDDGVLSAQSAEVNATVV